MTTAFAMTRPRTKDTISSLAMDMGPQFTPAMACFAPSRRAVREETCGPPASQVYKVAGVEAFNVVG